MNASNAPTMNKNSDHMYQNLQQLRYSLMSYTVEKKEADYLANLVVEEYKKRHVQERTEKNLDSVFVVSGVIFLILSISDRRD
jgi:hypothetical protein